MRIGIDARFLTHPQRGGFKTYTETVVAAPPIVTESALCAVFGYADLPVVSGSITSFAAGPGWIEMNTDCGMTMPFSENVAVTLTT